MLYFLLLDYVLLISIGLPDYLLKFYKFAFAVLFQMFTIIIMKDLSEKKNIPYQLLKDDVYLKSIKSRKHVTVDIAFARPISGSCNSDKVIG